MTASRGGIAVFGGIQRLPLKPAVTAKRQSGNSTAGRISAVVPVLAMRRQVAACASGRVRRGMISS